MRRHNLNPRRLVAEFVVIVLGVSVGLAAEDWRQGREESERAVQYLDRLRTELKEGQPTIRGITNGRLAESRAAIDTLLGVEGVGPITTSTDSARLIWNSSRYGFNTPAVVLDLTYREMLATGSLNLVRDLETRNAISEYYRLAYRVAAVVDETDSQGYRDWISRVRRAVGTTPIAVDQGEYSMGSQDYARLVAILSGDPMTAEGDLRQTRSQMINVQYWMTQLAKETEVLLAVLSAG